MSRIQRHLQTGRTERVPDIGHEVASAIGEKVDEKGHGQGHPGDVEAERGQEVGHLEEKLTVGNIFPPDHPHCHLKGRDEGEEVREVEDQGPAVVEEEET